MTGKEIEEIRKNIPPVQNQEVGRIPDSDDEEAKEDLARRRNINLANGRRIACNNQQKAQRILGAINAKCPGEQLYVSEILNMATENVTAQQETLRQKQVMNRADASLTPLKNCSGANAKAVLQSHEKRDKLALNKNARSKADSTCTATCSSVHVGPSQDQADLLFTAGTIRTSATFHHPISYVPDCDLSTLDDFCPHDDFL